MKTQISTFMTLFSFRKIRKILVGIPRVLKCGEFPSNVCSSREDDRVGSGSKCGQARHNRDDLSVSERVLSNKRD